MIVHDGIWRLPFTVQKVLDADTVRGSADLGWGVAKSPLDVRLDGLWSPENGTPEGDAATVWARSLLSVGMRLTLHSRWVLTFNRVVGDLYLSDASSYAALVVAAGHGTIR
ncbi:MAG: hypothetical protein M3N43_07355 [Actinomycetota bacterium]|nr:hypothetical protein [Actinomycetota bacterium]